MLADIDVTRLTFKSSYIIFILASTLLPRLVGSWLFMLTGNIIATPKILKMNVISQTAHFMILQMHPLKCKLILKTTRVSSNYYGLCYNSLHLFLNFIICLWYFTLRPFKMRSNQCSYITHTLVQLFPVTVWCMTLHCTLSHSANRP